MIRRFIQLIAVCVSAVLLAGCLSINVDKTETEHNSTNATTPVKNGPGSSPAESAD